MIVIEPYEWQQADIVSVNVPSDGLEHDNWYEDAKYRAFDPSSGTVTKATVAPLTFVLKPASAYDSIAFFNVIGFVVTIEVAGKTYTVALETSENPMFVTFPNRPNGIVLLENLVTGVGDFITLTITQSTKSATLPQVGAILVGRRAQIGDTLYSSEVGIQDYSRKERDTFGEVTIIERGFSDTARFTFSIKTAEIQIVKYYLATRRAKPTIYLSQGDPPDILIYGLYNSLSFPYENWNVSTASLEVESLILSVPDDVDPEDPDNPDGACYLLEFWEGTQIKLGDSVPTFEKDVGWKVATLDGGNAFIKQKGVWGANFAPDSCEIAYTVTAGSGAATGGFIYLVDSFGTLYREELPADIGEHTVTLDLSEIPDPPIDMPDGIAAFPTGLFGLYFTPNTDTFSATVSAIVFDPAPDCSGRDIRAYWRNPLTGNYTEKTIAGTLKRSSQDTLHPVGEFEFFAKVLNADGMTVQWQSSFDGESPPLIMPVAHECLVTSSLQTGLALADVCGAGTLSLTAKIMLGGTSVTTCQPITLVLTENGEIPPCFCYDVDNGWIGQGDPVPAKGVLATKWLIDQTETGQTSILASVGTWPRGYVMESLTFSYTPIAGAIPSTATTGTAYFGCGEKWYGWTLELVMNTGYSLVIGAANEVSKPAGLSIEEGAAAIFISMNGAACIGITELTLDPEPTCQCAPSPLGVFWYNAATEVFDLAEATGHTKTRDSENYPVGPFRWQARITGELCSCAIAWSHAYTGTNAPAITTHGNYVLVDATLTEDDAMPLAVDPGVLTLTATVTNGADEVGVYSATLNLTSDGALEPCGSECVTAPLRPTWYDEDNEPTTNIYTTDGYVRYDE